MPRYRFHTLDVFTDTPFGGNPLAVVLDADDLSGERMQVIAAEFNLSETVFVLKPAKPGANRRRVRIFTPRTELPFAGHPTVGASYLLAKLDLVEMDPADPIMVLEEGIGDVPVKVQSGNDSGKNYCPGGGRKAFSRSRPRRHRGTRRYMRACLRRRWVSPKIRPQAAPRRHWPVFCTTRTHGRAPAAG
jgi:predicted PhzF superfamily epimerase YddE/YHI9